jgi:hypothetical protein
MPVNSYHHRTFFSISPVFSVAYRTRFEWKRRTWPDGFEASFAALKHSIMTGRLHAAVRGARNPAGPRNSKLPLLLRRTATRSPAARGYRPYLRSVISSPAPGSNFSPKTSYTASETPGLARKRESPRLYTFLSNSKVLQKCSYQLEILQIRRIP